MKKKIAVFANGWNAENLHNMMSGICKGMENDDVDLFVFLAHLSYTQSDAERKSEQAIFGLPNLRDFDGAIVFGGSLIFEDAVDYIYDRCHMAGIPTVSVGLEKKDTYYVGVENSGGMKSLVEHIITKHNAKKFLYIAGDKNNNDSNERLKVLKDTMSKYYLVLNDEDVFYSDWEPNRAQQYVKDKLKKCDNLPDAVICANDPLAIFVTYGIEEAGYSCPDDILVTGFDFLKEGQRFYPSIASVKQDYYRLGMSASEVFKSIFEGKEAKRSTIIQCEFIPGESCGCIEYRDDDQLRKEYLREYPLLKAYEDYKSGRIHLIDKAIMESDTFESLPQKFRELFYGSNGREGKTFYMLIDPQFSELAYKDVKDMPAFSFAKNMRVVVAKEEGNALSKEECDIDKLIPEYDANGLKHMYVFNPAYMDQYVYAYIVMADNLKYFEEMFYYKLVKKFREDLIIYRKNLQLNELNAKLNDFMHTDALTGVKNRAAYEKTLLNIKHERAVGKATPLAVAMFDINNLKEANDTYGHEVGDEYIRRCSTYICNFFKHSPVYRIGGDEFVVFLQGHDYDMHESAFKEFRRSVEQLACDTSLPFVERISIASGIVDVNACCSDDIEAVVKKADELMYANKYEMKRKLKQFLSKRK